MKDREFLNWLADRLVNVYGESEFVDFVHKLRAIATFTDPKSDAKWLTTGETVRTMEDGQGGHGFPNGPEWVTESWASRPKTTSAYVRSINVRDQLDSDTATVELRQGERILAVDRGYVIVAGGEK